MKEKNIVNESETALSAPPSKEWRTAINKHLKAMANLCFIYDDYSRNLVKDQELGLRVDMSGTVDLVLADPL